jgi:glutamate dehydrogenase/leucine dehydrogenase
MIAPFAPLAEHERLCRGWIRQMARNLGPGLDVPAPDVMTSAQHMLWMLDEFEAIHGVKLPGFITGKPVGMGGSPGRAEATGYGVIAVLNEACIGSAANGAERRPAFRDSATSRSMPPADSRGQAVR